jgi:hypothetical protein
MTLVLHPKPALDEDSDNKMAHAAVCTLSIMRRLDITPNRFRSVQVNPHNSSNTCGGRIVIAAAAAAAAAASLLQYK